MLDCPVSFLFDSWPSPFPVQREENMYLPRRAPRRSRDLDSFVHYGRLGTLETI